MIIPVFSSHYSLNGSILTLDAVKNKENTSKIEPISICEIAKQNNLHHVTLVEDRIDGFVEAYKNLSSIGAQLIFGLKMSVCSDINIKDQDSVRNESSIIIFFKNTQGYNDAIKIWNNAWTEGFYYHGRTDWSKIKKYWTENLMLALPFFSSFLAKNTLHFASIVPDFPVKPEELFVFREVNSQLPFVSLIDESIKKFTEKTQAKIQNIKTIYYYEKKDFKPFVVMNCIQNGSKFNVPNKNHLSSDTFCWEDYKQLIS